jgi:hypothetical protein
MECRWEELGFLLNVPYIPPPPRKGGKGNRMRGMLWESVHTWGHERRLGRLNVYYSVCSLAGVVWRVYSILYWLYKGYFKHICFVVCVVFLLVSGLGMLVALGLLRAVSYMLFVVMRLPPPTPGGGGGGASYCWLTKYIGSKMGSSRGYILLAMLGLTCWVCRKDVCTVLKSARLFIYVRFERLRCVLAQSQRLLRCYTPNISRLRMCTPIKTYWCDVLCAVSVLYLYSTPLLCCAYLYTLCWVGVRGRVLTLLEKYHTDRANIWNRGLSRILALLEIGWTEFLLAKKMTV